MEGMNAFTKEDLKAFQSEPLDQKWQRSLGNIAEWFAYWDAEVYVAFSGGKDSSVLADMCGYWCSIIKKTLYLAFVDTGLEFPEIRSHVKFFAEYLRQKYGIEVVLDILRPKMRFDEVIKKYGYPMISKEVAKRCSEYKNAKPENLENTMAYKEFNGLRKSQKGNSFFNKKKWRPLLDLDFEISHKCCDVMKKHPSDEYSKKTGRKKMTAQMAVESLTRRTQWLRFGCNGFDMEMPTSNPMSFWTEQDVLQYIKKNEIPIASVYGDIVYAENPDQLRFEDIGIDCGGSEPLVTTGLDRTGCIFCGFGCPFEENPRFEWLKETHPTQYEYCVGGGGYNENGAWKPNKQGLGMGHVFDELNKIYGDGFIRY